MDYIQQGEYYLSIGHFQYAKKAFAYARRVNAQDWRCWFGLAAAITHNFTYYSSENWSKFVVTAKSLAVPEHCQYMDNRMGQFWINFCNMNNMYR